MFRVARRLTSIWMISILVALCGCVQTKPLILSSQSIEPTQIQTRHQNGWLLVENQPVATKYRVLLLPGFLCTDAIYRDMLNDVTMQDAGIQLVAGNPPGFKGLPVEKNFDFSLERYAEAVCELNEIESYDLIVGHSFFANVLIELAVSDRYQGSLMLLSPSLSRKSEDVETRFFDKIGRAPLVGPISMLAAYQAMNAMFEPYFIDEKKDKLPMVVAEAKKTPRYMARRLLNAFFDYIDGHGDLSKRLCRTSKPVLYVRGVDDNVKLLPAHRRQLAKADLIKIIEIKGSKHFVMIDHPEMLNQFIRKMIFGRPGRSIKVY